MNKKLALTIPLLALLIFGFMGQTYATLDSGVIAGDYFTYNKVSYWESTNSSASVPSDFLGINDTETHKATVIIVIGTNVTWDETATFSNGTVSDPFRITQDLDSGTFYTYTWWASVIGANMTAGSLIHPNGTDAIVINQTQSRLYGSGYRDTNIISFAAPILDETNTTEIGTQTFTYCYDKITGILVENRREMTQSGETGYVAVILEDTNLWSVGEVTPPSLLLPILVVSIVAIVIVVIVVIFYWKRRKQSKKKKLWRNH